MQTYAIIFNGVVVNIIDYEIQPSNPPAGMEEGYIAILANGAGIGWTYNNEILTPPKPYTSWILVNNVWNAPIPYPNDGKLYRWDENVKNWV
jgi:hypothetical protein